MYWHKHLTFKKCPACYGTKIDYYLVQDGMQVATCLQCRSRLGLMMNSAGEWELRLNFEPSSQMKECTHKISTRKWKRILKTVSTEKRGI